MEMDKSIPKKIFQKYDIRGVYPDEINESATASIVRVLAEKVFPNGKVVIGRDGRNSSPSLYDAVTKTLMEFGDIEAIGVGIITTPMLYFLVNHLKAAGGIMITASHNAKEYNGIKVVGKNSVFIGGEKIRTMML